MLPARPARSPWTQGPARELVPGRFSHAKFEPELLSSLEEDALEEALGLHADGPRSALRNEALDEFCRDTDGEKMTQDRFVHTAGRSWFYDVERARACFFACDRDGSDALSFHQFLVLKESFVHADAPQHPTMATLRSAAAFHFYDRDHSGMLSPPQLLDFVRDLCAGAPHVERAARGLFETWPCSVSLEQFTEQFGTASAGERFLQSEALSLQALLQGFRSVASRQRRVVFDGRSELSTPYEALGGDSRAVSTSEHTGHAVNPELRLDPEVRARGGWRGPLAAQRGSAAFDLASGIIDRAERLASHAAGDHGQTWAPTLESANVLLCQLLGLQPSGANEAAQAGALSTLAAACNSVLRAQPMVVHAAAPAKVFGDVHGQVRDLLLLFDAFGFPSHKRGDVQATSYIFDGDWVDRGPHQLEVVALLFALKVLYPARVYLVRGNHEFRHMSEEMGRAGFRWHCRRRLGKHWEAAYEAIHTAFEMLPLAAVVDGSVLVLHGGVGDGSWTLAQLEAQRRPLRDVFAVERRPAFHALWSDPSDSDSTMRRGTHASARGGNVPQFGPDVTADFCRANRIEVIVRAHQFVRQGFRVMHAGRCITVFSAPDYFSQDGEANDGALLLLAPDCNGHLRVHPKRISGRVNAVRPAKGAGLLDVDVCSGSALWRWLVTCGAG